MKFTKNSLRELIREELYRINKIQILENRKKEIEESISILEYEDFDYPEVDFVSGVDDDYEVVKSSDKALRIKVPVYKSSSKEKQEYKDIWIPKSVVNQNDKRLIDYFLNSKIKKKINPRRVAYGKKFGNTDVKPLHMGIPIIKPEKEEKFKIEKIYLYSPTVNAMFGDEGMVVKKWYFNDSIIDFLPEMDKYFTVDYDIVFLKNTDVLNKIRKIIGNGFQNFIYKPGEFRFTNMSKEEYIKNKWGRITPRIIKQFEKTTAFAPIDEIDVIIKNKNNKVIKKEKL